MAGGMILWGKTCARPCYGRRFGWTVMLNSPTLTDSLPSPISRCVHMIFYAWFLPVSVTCHCIWMWDGFCNTTTLYCASGKDACPVFGVFAKTNASRFFWSKIWKLAGLKVSTVSQKQVKIYKCVPFRTLHQYWCPRMTRTSLQCHLGGILGIRKMQVSRSSL